MPLNPETWYDEQVEKGHLPDKNGYYHYNAKHHEKENNPIGKVMMMIEAMRQGLA